MSDLMMRGCSKISCFHHQRLSTYLSFRGHWNAAISHLCPQTYSILHNTRRKHLKVFWGHSVTLCPLVWFSPWWGDRHRRRLRLPIWSEQTDRAVNQLHSICSFHLTALGHVWEPQLRPRVRFHPLGRNQMFLTSPEFFDTQHASHLKDKPQLETVFLCFQWSPGSLMGLIWWTQQPWELQVSKRAETSSWPMFVFQHDVCMKRNAGNECSTLRF